MARPKRNQPGTPGAPLDPMAAAILSGLKPHIEALVQDQVATLLADMLAKIAPERLAKVPDGARAAAEEAPSESALKTDSGPARVPNGSNGTKKNGSPAPGPTVTASES